MIFQKFYSFIVISVCLFPITIFSEQARPKIILALSGGGARGLAHIGVLKYFEENRIPIDGVVGTSMGGLIGAGYAMGHSIKEIENIIGQVDFQKLLSLNLNYNDLTVETKKNLRKYPLSINLKKSKKSVKNSSLYQTHHIAQFFDRLTLPYSYIENFDQLPIPFKCMTTDILKGESVILDKGLLSKALRATMAIPGLFPPIIWGDKILVDGGVLNNLPTDVAKTMGDIVIGIDVSEDLKPSNKLIDASSVMNQTITIMMLQSIKKNRELATICIRPDIQSFGLMDLKKSKEIIEKGYQEAKKMEDKLLSLALNKDEWNEYVMAKNLKISACKTQKIEHLKVHSKDPHIANWLAKEIYPLIEKDDILDLGKLESNLTLATDKIKASKIHYRLIDPCLLKDINQPSIKYSSTYLKIDDPTYLLEEGLSKFKEEHSHDLQQGDQKNDKKDSNLSDLFNESKKTQTTPNANPVLSKPQKEVPHDESDSSKKSKGFGVEPDLESSSLDKNNNKAKGFGTEPSSLSNETRGFGIEVVSVDDSKKKTTLSTGLEASGSGDGVQLNLGSRLSQQKSDSTTELDVNLGTDINIAYGQRFKIGQAMSIKPQVFFNNEINNYKSDIDPFPMITDRITSYGANLDLYWNIKNIIGLRGRYQYKKVSLPSVFIDSVSDTKSGNIQTISLKATYDHQNSATIVTNGLKLTGEATYYLSAPKLKTLTNNKKPLKLELQGAYAHPLGKGILRFNMGVGSIYNNTLPLNEQFSLGGSLKLSAFQSGELRDASYIFTNIGFLYPVKSFSLFPGKNTYITIWGEKGGVGPVTKKIVMNQNLFAGLIADSTLGPIFLGTSYGANKRFNFHFGVGNFF